MKHLQLTPPLLIITMGYPGAGKTFFTRQFAELHGLARVSEDRIRYELFEKPAFSAEETDIIGRLVYYFLEEAMLTEQTIICEGTFLSFKERKRLYELAQSKGYRTLTVWLQTDVETSAYRAMNRDRRNIDSKFNFSMDQTVFESVRTTLERPGEREVAIVISGKHAFKSQSLSVLRKIAALYSDSISRGDFGVHQNTVTKPRMQVRPGQRVIQ